MNYDRNSTHSNNYQYQIYEILINKINWFIENYAPETLTIPGFTNLRGDTVIGDSSDNTLTVNANTTHNGTVDFNKGITVNGLFKADDDVIIGQTGTDELTINATSLFNSPVTLEGSTEDGGNTGLIVTNNVILGSGRNNSVISRGVMNAPVFTMIGESGNGANLGIYPLILYRDYTTNGAHIWSDYGSTGNVILVVKNIYSGSGGSASITVTYNSNGDNITLAHNAVAMFTKTSTSGYTQIK